MTVLFDGNVFYVYGRPEWWKRSVSARCSEFEAVYRLTKIVEYVRVLLMRNLRIEVLDSVDACTQDFLQEHSWVRSYVTRVTFSFALDEVKGLMFVSRGIETLESVDVTWIDDDHMRSSATLKIGSGPRIVCPSGRT